jgi:hypothetical protein
MLTRYFALVLGDLFIMARFVREWWIEENEKLKIEKKTTA